MSDSKFQGKHSDITGLILNAFHKVHRELGYGFNEKVYENSLALELRKLGLQVAQQHEIEVFYDGVPVGTYLADLIVDDVVIIELKAVKELSDEHEAQLLNYLKATQIEVGLLLNFGPTTDTKRRVYDNERKGSLMWVKKPDTDAAKK